jgi:Zn finger protein HypA/HybF involved in hydrogenase expression
MSVAAAWAMVDYWKEPVELSCLDCRFYFTLPRDEAKKARFCPVCGKAPLCKPDADFEPA